MTRAVRCAALLAVLAPLSAAPIRAQEIRFNVIPYRLDNGLKILALEDHTVPALSYYTFFRVGSRDERPGRTGVSHLFEHMMFNGTKKFGAGVFDRMLESKGGASNAFTTSDITVYFENLPSEALDMVVELEADRMAGLAVTEESLAKEREVVKEERRLRTDNDVEGSLWELLQGTAYLAHSYQWPVVGWMPDLDAITVKDCEEYFRVHYAPNNATIILVGDFKPDRAIGLISKAYGSIPAQPAAPPPVANEPEQKGERRALLRRAAQLPAVAFAYHVPASSSDDLFALDLLQIILGGGESSRLVRRLVYEKELATRVDVENMWRIDPGLFVIYAEAKPGVTPEALEAALSAEIDLAGKQEAGASELQKAKNIRTTSQVKALKTNGGKAEQLGLFETYLGSHTRLFTVLKSYEAVTAAGVMKTAARYLRPDNRTIVTVVPEGAGEEAKP
ncbi:MAG TPA: pitrilysin family protein [Candidatus Polarisedimenticolia bacterium]|jgi:predicted Zn-dependent peptidase|nr:pitrilysin family protein [Candidatus Polarisedimenticolia bacterium]